MPSRLILKEIIRWHKVWPNGEYEFRDCFHGPYAAEYLARKHPHVALVNVDNYAYFVLANYITNLCGPLSAKQSNLRNFQGQGKKTFQVEWQKSLDQFTNPGSPQGGSLPPPGTKERLQEQIKYASRDLKDDRDMLEQKKARLRILADPTRKKTPLEVIEEEQLKPLVLAWEEQVADSKAQMEALEKKLEMFKLGICQLDFNKLKGEKLHVSKKQPSVDPASVELSWKDVENVMGR